MPLFRKAEPIVVRTAATVKFVVRDEDTSFSDVWGSLTRMFNGKEPCIVLHMDRLIPVTSGPVTNGSKFEDYNAGGPRGSLTVTSWNPDQGVLAFRYKNPPTVEDENRDNSWEYQFILDEIDDRGGIRVDIQLVIEHQKSVRMDACETLDIAVISLCHKIFPGKIPDEERERARPGYSNR